MRLLQLGPEGEYGRELLDVDGTGHGTVGLYVDAATGKVYAASSGSRDDLDPRWRDRPDKGAPTGP